MATLYDLCEKLAMFEFEIDEETGEILNAGELDKIEIERNEKIENIALWIKNLKSDAEAYEKEEKNFAKKKQTAKNKMESLKSYLTFALNGDKFKTDRVTISYRASDKVEIVDESKIDESWLIPQPPKVDKAGIKEALKRGEVIKGAELVHNSNIQIK